jgi:hypothetical protein
MESVLIEYFRFDDQNTGVLSDGRKYILAHKNLPAKEVTTSLSQIDLLNAFSQNFDYNSDISNEEKWKAIVEISEKIRELFIDVSGYTLCQLDVVLNASELCLLPFELLLNENQVPYFADPDKKIAFTRRLRQSNFENSFTWPYIPKVLFVYSNGGLRDVPFEDHLYELDRALTKWGGSAKSEIFKLLTEATFDELQAELKNNDSLKNQYTHVHILAHGKAIEVKNKPWDYETGIAFGTGKEPATNANSIKELFESLQNKPLLVNYMVCDGANFFNPLKPDKNPVQVTHRAGVPIVLGSQFPLSMDGSTLITRLLYYPLFNGEDIRAILNETRIKLFAKREDHHDWISLVSYLRLPEGYNDYLYKASLYSQMQNLKYIKRISDEYLVKRQINEDKFIATMTELLSCINCLEKKLGEIENNKKYEEEVLENLGLLGSSYKRLAELNFISASVKDLKGGNGFPEQKAALQKSLEFYKRACNKNLSHHWSLVQYLSLDVVLNNQLSDMDSWFSARKSITISIEKNPGDGWAYGSLLELFLLHCNTGSTGKDQVTDALGHLIDISKKNKDVFLLESTRDQVSRYKNWWTAENGFNINKQSLASDSEVLDHILNTLNGEIGLVSNSDVPAGRPAT